MAGRRRWYVVRVYRDHEGHIRRREITMHSYDDKRRAELEARTWNESMGTPYQRAHVLGAFTSREAAERKAAS